VVNMRERLLLGVGIVPGREMSFLINPEMQIQLREFR